MSTKIETRVYAELRAGNAFALGGVAASYGTISHNLGGFKERIAPGAFARSLKANADVVATFNHDANKVLGRTKSGTLTLADSTAGLVWYCQLDKDNSDHVNLYASVKRGDVSQCSFAFSVPDGGDSWGSMQENGRSIKLRTLTDVDLIDVAAVTYPAYPGTTVDARKAAPVSAEVRSRLDDFLWKENMNRRLKAAMLKG